MKTIVLSNKQIVEITALEYYSKEGDKVYQHLEFAGRKYKRLTPYTDIPWVKIKFPHEVIADAVKSKNGKGELHSRKTRRLPSRRQSVGSPEDRASKLRAEGLSGRRRV